MWQRLVVRYMYSHFMSEKSLLSEWDTFFGDNYVLHNGMTEITFPDLERVTGDVFIGKYEFCLIDGTCSDQQYNDNLSTVTFGEDIVIEQDLEVKENAQLPRVSFQRTVSVGGSVTQGSNGSTFCFQSANNTPSILSVDAFSL